MKLLPPPFTCRACCLITLFAGLRNYAPAAGNPEKTQELIAVLQSNAGLFDKARACQQLGEFGTREAVPALAALLADEQLSAYARSGLEGIADPRAAEALRATTSHLKGDQLIGVINSLGVLRDAQAVGLLRKLAADSASGAVKESLLALGRISTDESVQIVRQALTDGPEQFRAEAAAACLLAAESLLTAGQSEKAVALYEAVRAAKVPLSYRVGATRGAILARQENGIPLLVEVLRSEERAIRNAALLTIRQFPGDGLASALNAELPNANPELKLLLLAALVDCHNPQSIQVIESTSAGGDAAVKKTALSVIGKIGGPAAAEVLLRVLAKNATAEEVSIASDGLKQMEGKDIDGLVLRALPTATDPKFCVQLIALTAARGLTNATAELLKQAAAPDVTVGQAALGALAELAGPNDLPALIGLTASRADEQAREAAGNALVSTCRRTGQSAMAGEALLAELNQATDPMRRVSWIKTLISLGYAKALPALKQAMTDPNETVAASAVRELGRWPDPAPVEDLLAMAERPAKPAQAKLALASAIQLATVAAEEHQRPDQDLVAWLQRADQAAQSVESKRRILSALGRVQQLESFRIVLPYLDNPDLQTEAAQAIVQMAPALVRQDNPGIIIEALEKIAVRIQNPGIRDQAVKIARSVRVK